MDYKNKLIISANRNDFLEYEEETNFVKDLIGLDPFDPDGSDFKFTSEYERTWYTHQDFPDNENFKLKDEPLLYVKRTTIEKPYDIPRHFSTMDNDYNEEYCFKGEVTKGEGLVYFNGSHNSAYIDGELEDVVGYDILRYVHGNLPLMKRIGDTIEGLLFMVDDPENDYNCTNLDSDTLSDMGIPHKIFEVVKGRKLVMFPILYYFCENSTNLVDDNLYHDIVYERPPRKSYVYVRHTCYAKADNQTSREEIEYYKNKYAHENVDVLGYTVKEGYENYYEIVRHITVGHSQHIYIPILEYTIQDEMNKYQIEKSESIKKQIKENGGKTNFEIENDPIWCKELDCLVPRRDYETMKSLNDFDKEHIKWLNKGEENHGI